MAQQIYSIISMSWSVWSKQDVYLPPLRVQTLLPRNDIFKSTPTIFRRLLLPPNHKSEEYLGFSTWTLVHMPAGKRISIKSYGDPDWRKFGPCFYKCSFSFKDTIKLLLVSPPPSLLLFSLKVPLRSREVYLLMLTQWRKWCKIKNRFRLECCKI